MSQRKTPPQPGRAAARAKPVRARTNSASSAPAIRLLLVDDHPIVREGLRSCLARHPRLRIIGEAASGEDALRLARRLKPDLVQMDINLPGINGLAAAARLRRTVPAAKVLILSVHENREYAAEVARCGARGYVLKDAAPDELVRAIEAVHGGAVFFSPPVATALLQCVSRPAAPRGRPDLSRLTTRERDVLALIAVGASSKTIAERLRVALSTVKTLRERLMRKLDLHSIAALTRFAVARGLAPRPPAGTR